MGKNIISQRRGKGSPTFRSPSHRHPGPVSFPPVAKARGVVKEILHAPGRSAPLARVKFEEGEYLMIAPDGMYEGQEISIGSGEVERGNVMEIGKLPEGTLIYNIEVKPGDGGKLCRAAGSAAVIITQGERTVVQLPSGQFRSLEPSCRAQVGVVAGSGHKDRPYAKAGKKIRALASKAKEPFKVRGVAMNAVSHPHGGGSHQHVGRPSTVSRNAPPGRKVGRLSPKRKKRK
jgi:large subunit ribosomal protein L2